MTIPAQIQKQSAQVQELYKAMEQDPPNDDSVDNNADDEQPPAPPAPPAPPPPPAPDYRDQELVMLRERLGQMERLLAATPRVPPQPPAPPAPKQKPKLVTEKDVEEYGEAVDVMRRAAREEIASLYEDQIDELKATINDLRKQLGDVVPRVQHVQQRQVVSAEQQFLSDLTRLVPNWEQVNQDAKFHNWLLEVDSLSGLTRQTYLDDAQRNFDVKRVAKFFENFAAISGTSQNPPGGNTPSRRQELEQHVVPGRSKATSTGQNNNPNVYTREDIRRFYADVAQGKYKGKDQDRARIESDIFLAQRENRVT